MRGTDEARLDVKLGAAQLRQPFDAVFDLAEASPRIVGVGEDVRDRLAVLALEISNLEQALRGALERLRIGFD